MSTQHLVFGRLDELVDFLIVVETVFQSLVDGFIHPVFRLLISTILEIAIFLYLIYIIENHFQHLVDTQFIETRIAKHLWKHTTFGHWEEMERIAELSGSQMCPIYILAICLINDDSIGNFHNSSLDSLQLISRSRELNEEEEIHHRVACRFALPHSHGFNEDMIVACRFTKNDAFACLACHTSKRPSCWRRTNERLGMHSQAFHAGLISEDGTFGLFGTWVDGKDCQFSSVILEKMSAKHIDGGTLSRSWNTTDTHSH